MELYIHIPFCVRKCAYCDFLSFPTDEETIEAYLRALHAEIRAAGFLLPANHHVTAARSYHEDSHAVAKQLHHTDRHATATQAHKESGGRQEMNRVTSIFFGGGTPSLLAAEQITTLMDVIRASFDVAADAEISIEVNPGTADEAKLRTYMQAGVNRMSIGCQSFSDETLKKLGRIHDRDAILSCVSAARAAGCANLNLDLISGIPGQTLADWRRDLAEAAALAPEHISAYSLIVEEGTPFYEMRDALDLPDEETERAMYEETAEILRKYGYEQYEISNYAKPGYACRHNIGYWTGVPYLGLGLGAASFLYCTDGRGGERPETPGIVCDRSGAGSVRGDENAILAVRWNNTSDLREYLSQMQRAEEMLCCCNADTAQENKRIKDHCAEAEELSVQDLQDEYMILGLRMTAGVSEEEYTWRFGETPDARYGEVIRKHVQDGLLARSGGRIFLTRRGRSLANRVMADFL